MPAPYEKRRIAVDSSHWTAIAVSFNCNSLSLKNLCAGDLKLRTSWDDASTEDTLPSGGSEVLMAAPALDEMDCRDPRCRFKAGTTVCYVQAAEDSGMVVLTFLQ